MGTSSMIANLNEDGSVTATYCHYDGYVSHNGRLLIESYNTSESAKTVAESGYLSALSTSGLEASLENSVHKEKPIVYASAEVFLKCGDNAMGGQYLYLFDGEDWLFSPTNERGSKRNWTMVSDKLEFVS